MQFDGSEGCELEGWAASDGRLGSKGLKIDRKFHKYRHDIGWLNQLKDCKNLWPKVIGNNKLPEYI